MKGIFGIDHYRSEQLPAMNATMEGKDVVLLLPTGGGKVRAAGGREAGWINR